MCSQTMIIFGLTRIAVCDQTPEIPWRDIPGVLLHVTEDSKDPYDTYDPSSKWSALAQGVHSCFQQEGNWFPLADKTFWA